MSPAPDEPDPTEVEPTDNSSGVAVDAEQLNDVAQAEEIEREAREADPG